MSSPSRSGVFDSAADPRVEKFTESVTFDRRLYAHDIDGSVAHATMLAKVGILSPAEREQIVNTLGEIRRELDDDVFELRIELEDIHMHIEQALIDRLGDVGRKLHTARSRNDQIATDLRLWVRAAIDRTDTLLANLQRAFVARAEADADVILPAYTHLRRAQPVLAAHYWLAYCEKFQRDRDRLADARRRVNILPLGTAALAGTSLPIDRDEVARLLGFESVAANSLDVSSDRDYVLEAAFALSLVAGHLSGWAEEWILWSTCEFNFIKLPEAFCTGSSIMPQKVNPDVLELIRGKTARVMGNVSQLLVLIKGLPLAYNRDLQEDKPPLFDSFDTVEACLELAAPMVADTLLNHDAIASGLERGYLDATTLMEYLIARGMPQRTAHHTVGALVRKATEQGLALSALPLETLREIDDSLDENVYTVLGCENAVRAFTSYGSTAPEEVDRQLQCWKNRLTTS